MASTFWRGPEQDKVALRQYLAANGRSPTEARDAPADMQPLAPQSGGGFLDGIGKLFGGGSASDNQTEAWLQSQGLDPGMAKIVLNDKRLLQSFMLDRMKGGGTPEGFTLGEGQVRYDAAGNPIASGPAKTQAEKMTDDLREYQEAVKQGFTGTFMEYQVKMKEAGRNQINIDTGVKLPNGYRWKNPEDQGAGVEPIPGGPAEEIPAELAARIGMADSFLGQYDDLRKKLASGEATGIWDRGMAGMGVGGQGETYRQLQSGVDALMRLLTGAGMNETEAKSYAERYLPTYRDNAESATSKLDQLKRELLTTREMALRGRGNIPAPTKGTTAPPEAPQDNGGRKASEAKPGDVFYGFRFKGGDATDPQSWEKVQ